MTLDECIKYAEQMVEIGETYEVSTGVEEYRQLAEWLKDYKRLLEQEPCEDCISRETARRIVDSGRTRRHMIDMILATPPVTPQPKTGRWILQRIFPTKLYDEHLNEYECSECGRRIRCTESQLVNYPYCHCGAKMVEPQESEE